jgi:hypothetical protein
VLRVRFVACWCARLMVESTEASQSIKSAASAVPSRMVRTASQLPFLLNLRWRFHTVCHGPKHALRSRQAIPVRYR